MNNNVDVVFPINGFENVFNPSNEVYNYDSIWLTIEKLQLVQDYLVSNPTASMKIFLYKPSVGMGNPVDWDWVIFLKN